MSPENKRSAIEACKIFHIAQVDNQGAPYWLHPYRVALEAEKFGKNEKDKTILFYTGLFHDVLEDTSFYPEDIDRVVRECGDWSIVDIVLRNVLLLTKQKILRKKYYFETLVEKVDMVDYYSYDDSSDTYCIQIGNMINATMFNADAEYCRIVKLCDNLDNSLEWRAKPGKVAGEKYVETIARLKDRIVSYNKIQFNVESINSTQRI